MKKTKIICSIGPASEKVEVMQELVLNGMNCARINLSHASRTSILNTIEIIREVRKSTSLPVAIMYDTKGPEFRTLEIINDGISLKRGDTIKLEKRIMRGNKDSFSVNHPEALDKINIGNHVLVDNALLDLEVIDKHYDYLVLKALNDGEIKSHKTINVPGINLELPFISETDRADIIFAAEHSCDYLALSFVNSKEDVLEAREIVEEANGDARIIAKIESKAGIDNIDEIIAVSDGIMIARGDLGVEVPMEDIPILQKEIIKKCRENSKFAIVATEMLASMYTSPRPTRAEVSDVANAVLDGTDCVMLSGETTVGRYPVQAVSYMSRICKRIESTIDYSKYIEYIDTKNISSTIAKLVADAVNYNDIKAVVVTTISGYTARTISNLRPNCPILACCPSNHIAEKVELNFGVESIVTRMYDTTDEMIKDARDMAIKKYNLKPNNLIIVTAGLPLGKATETNFIQIVKISNKK